MKEIPLDCVIIGAGPAGICSAINFEENHINYLVIEKGVSIFKRKKETSKDITSGFGGGGLYSDGKLSFYPSGTNVYSCNYVEESYNKLRELLSSLNIQIPKTIKGDSNTSETLDFLKKYDSIVLGETQLLQLCFFLQSKLTEGNIIFETEVIQIEKINPNEYFIHLSNGKTLITKNIIYAGGKFGSYFINKSLTEPQKCFKKFEVGIRLEFENSFFDYQEINQKDFKLIIPIDDELEVRTFCFCKNGQIVDSKNNSISSFNGVSNITSSSKTNFGLNFRIKTEEKYESYKQDIEELRSLNLSINLDEFLKLKTQNRILTQLLSILKIHFPGLLNSNAKIRAPSFEYTGFYPMTDLDLKIKDENIWMCGDSTGDFRGLMPALLSGFITSQSVSYHVNLMEKKSLESVRLKMSSTKDSPVIFTAQSKKFFYCKDVICEYVLKMEKIPVNPFRVFEYFLNDRVDRSIIRRGNNELIKRCDELWIFGPISDGVFFEIARAYKLKMPVKFFTIGTFSHEIKLITDINDLVFEPEVHAKIPRDSLLSFIKKGYNFEPLQAQLELNIDV